MAGSIAWPAIEGPAMTSEKRPGHGPRGIVGEHVRVPYWVGRGQWDAVAISAAVLLAFCFAFGGASRLHELRLAITELAALPLLALAIPALLSGEDRKHSGLFLTLAALIAAIPLVQLIPLPPSIWTALPGRQEAALALEVTGAPTGWTTLSLTPDRTWQFFLALIPPLAMLAVTVRFTPFQQRWMVYLLLGGTALSIALAAAQLASGGSRLYLWPTTDVGSAAGFFANRNHMATLCLIALPFATILGARHSLSRGRSDPGPMQWFSMFFVGLILVAVAATQSRTGIALFGPALGASIVAAWVASGRGRPKPVLLATIGAASVACLAIALFALQPLLDRFATVDSQDGRFENWPIIVEAADAYLPLGSGLGSFDTVFRSVEPLVTLDATFFNQAHNEYLEIWLETGWFGAGVLILFVIWFARRSFAAWSSRSAAPGRDLQRAASIAIVVVLLHSGADYPLRTVMVATVFAFCCGLLELAGRSDAQLGWGGEGRQRERRRRRISQ